MLTLDKEVPVGLFLRRLAEARGRSDALFGIVHPDSLYERPIAERHRIIFYLGHLEAFDWNLLQSSLPGLRTLNAEFDRLFAFGIDPVDGGLPSDLPSDWPTVKCVTEYAHGVRKTLDEKLNKESVEARVEERNGFSLSTLLNVAIEHRLMHVETLAYMFHQLPLESKIGQSLPVKYNAGPVNHRMVEIPRGVALLGLRRDSDEFGWDNEFEAHAVDVPAFEIDQYKVTNRQYLNFMEAGGYELRSLWSDADWEWKTVHNISHPAFWRKAQGRWWFRAMLGELPLPLDCPVYVSYAEASAYATWAGKSLPTEAEWHRAAYGNGAESERFYPWGYSDPTPHFGNYDFASWDPAPVNAFPQGQSAFGVDGMLGNGWEWTSSTFGPFGGFEPFPFYPGYSANFFDSKHFVLKGGSPRTARCMLRPTFRNWFQPHYQYVYAGFRCVMH